MITFSSLRNRVILFLSHSGLNGHLNKDLVYFYFTFLSGRTKGLASREYCKRIRDMNELFKFILTFICFRSRQVLTWDLNTLNALNSQLLRFFKSKVSLPQEEISRNSKVVNSLLSMILENIRIEDKMFSLKQLNTGA